MTAYREAVVSEVLSHRDGLVRLALVDGGRAYGLTQLTGPVDVGDQVVVNTTAVDRGLGTGGWHVVHWNLSAPPFREVGRGHLMKLRYTSLQVDTGAAEEDDGDGDGDDVMGSEGLDGIPVVVAGLHSHVPVLAAAIAAHAPGTRVAYVMTDGGALPLAMSDVVADLRRRDLLVGTVTAGHAFGGDHEALNVPSALLTARRRLDAEVVVVAMGPGVAGTGTRLGFSGLEVAPALDAVAWLGGRPVAALRCSGADPRPRHQGISHHALTVLDAVRSPVEVAVPPGLEVPAELMGPEGRHRWHVIDPGDVGALLGDAGLVVRTMGRDHHDDPLFFRAAAAAGILAAAMVADGGPVPARGAASGGVD